MMDEERKNLTPEEMERMFDANPWFYIGLAALNVGVAVLILGCLVGLVSLVWDWL